MSEGAHAVGQPLSEAPRRSAVLALPGTAVLLASVVGLTLSETGIELASGFPPWIAVAGLIGLGAMAVAAWAVRSERPLVAGGISVAMVGLAVPSWAAWDWLPPALLPVLLAAGPMAVPGVAQAALGWSSRNGGRAALIATYVLAGVGAAMIAIAYEPFAEPGCAVTCARTDPIAASVISARGAVVATAALLVVAAAIAGRLLLGNRSLPPVLAWGVGASLLLLVASWVIRAWRWAEPLPPITWFAPHVLAALLIGGAVLAAALIVRRERLAAERLITELNDPASALGHGRVRAVEFAIPGEGRWVAADGGAPSPRPASGDVIVLHDAGEPGVRLWLDHGASPPALDEVGSGARVSLATARLAAVTRARLSDVRESQRRIVRASDDERRRIERDLHDGAQQRLISASLHVSLAKGRLPAASVDRAQSAISDALEHLRHLAHGTTPGDLRGEGLRRALEDVAREFDVPFSFDVEELPIPDDVAAAIHATVTAVMGYARDRRLASARVRLARSANDHMTLGIELDGLSSADEWDASVAADRIGAVGGSMTVNTDTHRLILEAELPCES